ALACFELVAVPTERDAANLRAYCARELDATLLPAGALRLRGRPVRVVVQPPGIDASTRAAEAAVARTVARADLFAFDAVDASRALPQRLRAYSRVLARCEARGEHPSLLQLLAPAPPDPNARALRRRVLALAMRINGRHGDPDTTPVRCVESAGAPAELAALQRASRVGLFTPIADAVGIGAQDWVACQDPGDPGVLVLSRHAATAPWLDGALLVDARDPNDCATAIERALAMPLVERRNRWQCAWRALVQRDGGRWLETLLARWRDDHVREALSSHRVVAMRPPAIAAACDPQR
ncbi:MAG TPA: trehalose-6-phosphate synthase, partial [Xanthomonadales bacterium]|nr:trehalose-6-phosphate synthase [Xanthomonadales bacterium]